jgi:hypothetical protein
VLLGFGTPAPAEHSSRHEGRKEQTKHYLDH